jgi:hypothetical protein
MLCRRLVGFLGRELRPSQDSDLHSTAQKRKRRRHANSPRVKFERVMTVREEQKTVQHPDRADNVIGECYIIGAVKGRYNGQDL